MKKLLLCLSFLLSIFISGCFPGVYKLDIQQGNIIDREKISQLQLGMTKQQVRYVLGTPMIANSFDQNRWDYYYSLKDSKDNFRQERLAIFFENGHLAKVDNQISADSPAPIVSTDQAKLPDPDPDAKKEK